MGLVDAGLGVAVLPSHARPLAKMHHIAFLKIGAPLVRRDVRLVTRRGRTLSPAATHFRDFIVEFVHSPAAKEDGWRALA
jgi:DNA-binding transcriptional LysR family regulator